MTCCGDFVTAISLATAVSTGVNCGSTGILTSRSYFICSFLHIVAGFRACVCYSISFATIVASSGLGAVFFTSSVMVRNIVSEAVTGRRICVSYGVAVSTRTCVGCVTIFCTSRSGYNAFAVYVSCIFYSTAIGASTTMLINVNLCPSTIVGIDMIAYVRSITLIALVITIGIVIITIANIIFSNTTFCCTSVVVIRSTVVLNRVAKSVFVAVGDLTNYKSLLGGCVLVCIKESFTNGALIICFLTLCDTGRRLRFNEFAVGVTEFFGDYRVTYGTYLIGSTCSSCAGRVGFVTLGCNGAAVRAKNVRSAVAIVSLGNVVEVCTYGVSTIPKHIITNAFFPAFSNIGSLISEFFILIIKTAYNKSVNLTRNGNLVNIIITVFANRVSYRDARPSSIGNIVCAGPIINIYIRPQPIIFEENSYGVVRIGNFTNRARTVNVVVNTGCRNFIIVEAVSARTSISSISLRATCRSSYGRFVTVLVFRRGGVVCFCRRNRFV